MGRLPLTSLSLGVRDACLSLLHSELRVEAAGHPGGRGKSGKQDMSCPLWFVKAEPSERIKQVMIWPI